MKRILLFFIFCVFLSGFSKAQTTQANGQNPNADAPVNVAAPNLKPAQPATYTASPLPQAQKGQFYVKDDKPATSNGIIIQPLSPADLKELERMNLLKLDATPPQERPATGKKQAASPQKSAPGNKGNNSQK